MKTIFRGKKIIIADDDPINKMLLENILKREGYTVIAADNGYTCLELVKRHLPDMVVIDIMMPDISGIKVAETIKKDAELALIPVIFVTGATDDQTLTKAFDAGCVDYVQKPVNRVELIKRVQSVFNHLQLIKIQKTEDQLHCVSAMGGTICHELNQPLQYISGMAQILMMDFKTGSKEYQTLKKMYAQISRMAEIVNRYKDVSDVETADYLGRTHIMKIDR